MAANPQRVRVIHSDSPGQELKAYLTRAGDEATTLRFDDVPDPRPAWLTELRIERLFLVYPEPATLFNCLSLTGVFSVFAPEVTFEVPVALMGGHFERESPSFDTLTLFADGCAPWFGLNGFRDFREIGSLSGRIAFKHSPVEPITWSLPSGWHFTYQPRARPHLTRRPNWSLSVEEYPTFTIKAPHLMGEKALLRAMSKAIAFIDFAIDEHVWFGSVHLANSSNPDQEVEFVAKWKQGERPHRFSDLTVFQFRDVAANFGEHLSRWFELYESLPLALDLYRVCKEPAGPPAELRFFAIMSALEGLHSSLLESSAVASQTGSKGARKMSLESRLRDIVARYGTHIGDLLPKSKCKRVADTRNYLAHQTPSLQARALPASETFQWYRRLAMVFEICVLTQLPFSGDETLKRIVDRRWNMIRNGSLGEWDIR